MTISEYNANPVLNINSTELETKDLLSYLSQIVLTLIDGETKVKKNKLDEIKKKIAVSYKHIQEVKNINSKISSELSKQKALNRVLGLILTLIREGKLAGQNRKQVLNILENIDTKNFQYLRSLEEKLGTYL